MTKRISTLALIAFLTSSLAFAGDNEKTNSSVNNPTVAVENGPNPCGQQTKRKKEKRQSTPATEQDEQFNRVLQGIYG